MLFFLILFFVLFFYLSSLVFVLLFFFHSFQGWVSIISGKWVFLSSSPVFFHSPPIYIYIFCDILSFSLTTTMVKSNISNKSFAFRAYLTPRPSLLVLVSPQTHSTYSLAPAPELANASTTEDACANVTLSDAPLGVSLLLKTQGRHPLSLSLPPPLKRVMRIAVLRHLLPLGPPKASSLLTESLCSSLLLLLSLLLKGAHRL